MRQVIDGRYAIVRELGAGSMGVVYLAEEAALDRTVAVKVIAPGHAADPLTAERFKKEAQALAKIRHQNVVQIYSFGHHDGSFYFAMEYVAGRSLEEAIDVGETVDVARGLEILHAIASGLAAVHDRKLVHRDVKPSNIVIETDTGRPVLIDFGLARRRSASSGRISITAGTPMYMAPEQSADPDGTRVTFRADIYALACTAFELFTGRPLFEGDVFEILTGHLKVTPPALSSRRPDLAVLDAAFARALAKDPTQRHDSALAFVEEMALALRKDEDERRRDTAPPSSTVRHATGPDQHVLVLARDAALGRQMSKVTSRVVASSARTPVVDHVTSAKALLARFLLAPAAIVLVDQESSEMPMADLVRAIREAPGGRSASVIVVSREWQALRPALAAHGIQDVLAKPIAVQLLTAAVERIVARQCRSA